MLAGDRRHRRGRRIVTAASDPIERIGYVLALARRFADPRDALGLEARRTLVASSGLSPEGVELALTTSLETDATEQDLASLVAWAGTAPRCHVVSSANVCTAAVRVVALALAASSAVFVKPSRRDPGLAPLIARELDPRAGTVTLVDRVEAAAGDQVHAYGSDATLDAIARELPQGVRLRAHGTGFGLAFVGRGADLELAARGLAHDAVLFDQAGCLSPRAAFVLSGARARDFAEALDAALGDLGRAVPLGPAARAAKPEVALYAEAMRAVGTVFEKHDHTVTLDEEPGAWVLPPAGRVVPVLSVASAEEARNLLGSSLRFVTNLGVSDGTDDALRGLSDGLPGVRVATLGSMQAPPLDGPVDRRPGLG
jgi:hypothetical protein